MKPMEYRPARMEGVAQRMWKRSLAAVSLAFGISIPAAAYALPVRVPERPDAGVPLLEASQKLSPPGESCSVRDGKVEYLTSIGSETFFVPLKPEEKILDSACIRDRAFIRTNTSLVAMTYLGGPATRRPGGIRISAPTHVLRIDLEEISKDGIVAWTQSHDVAYVLTEKDRKLRPLTIDESDDTKVYTLPFAVRGARMFYFSGMLFMAQKEIGVMAMAPGDMKAITYLPLDDDGSAFEIKKGRLFFGKKEIAVTKNDVTVK